jgi:inorganic triphosphatase YgiF
VRHQHRELELKVELSKSDLARLDSKLKASQLAAGPVSHEKLHSTYFDTARHDLHAAGISLRLRRRNGAWLQTLKAEHHINGGVSDAIEVEAAIEAEIPDLNRIGDKRLRRKLRKMVNADSLLPVFETVVQRTARNLKMDGSELELAVDEGEIRARGISQKLLEAELELKSGSARGLLAAAEALFIGDELTFSTQSKSDRGYQLLGKRSTEHTDTGALGERPLRFKRNDTSAEALAEILASAAHQIITARQQVLETEDSKGAHQLRIGLRRLRGALRTLRPFVASASLENFEQSARNVAQLVGGLRNADVLINSIYAPIEKLTPNRRGFRELARVLARHREAKRREVRAALSGAEWKQLQLYLTLWPRTLEEVPSLRGPILKYARKALDKTWRKTFKLGKRIDRLNIERRHELRKTLKELRYLAEFFSVLYNQRKAQRFIEQLKALQDVLGYLNDVRMADQLRVIQEKELDNPKAASAAGYILGRHETEAEHVWKRAGKAWDKLEASPKVWIR